MQDSALMCRERLPYWNWIRGLTNCGWPHGAKAGMWSPGSAPGPHLSHLHHYMCTLLITCLITEASNYRSTLDAVKLWGARERKPLTPGAS